MKRIFFLSVLILTLTIFIPSASAQQAASSSHSYKVTGDGNIELRIDVILEQGWYMYGVRPIENGPMATTLEIVKSDDFEMVGTLSEVTPARQKFDEGFSMDVDYYEEKASFKQLIKPIKKGDFTVEATLTFQTCNGQECLINENDMTFDIKLLNEVVNTSETSQSRKNSQSLWVFLLVAFAAGLGGVITPCVFPMIPMTVGFLVNGGGSKRSGIVKGLIFGLSVTLIYTLLGLIVALFQSTSATDALGAHWIPNLIFALLFLVFAISFLGAFEITLPSGLANKADKQADKGGYIAAFFMAFAMVIVSFSCTGPFVGSILAAAVVGGVALKPILGMAVFGIAFSLPFVVFSFFPGIMKKMPKSGGWLNVVKVVFAFILLAFAIKFFYNVDSYFGWGVITRLGFLSIWITLVILLGLYFLGIVWTNHDTQPKGIGWGRVMAAIVCFAFSFYMLPGLFGAPLKAISGMIPPQDGSTIVLQQPSSGATSSSPISNAYSALPSFSNIEDAVAQSKIEGKPILLYFKSHTCSVCKVMEATVLNDPTVLDILKRDYIIANLYVDDKTPDSQEKTLGRRLRKYQTSHFQSASQPLYVVIDSAENTLAGPIGSSSVEEYIDFLTLEK